MANLQVYAGDGFEVTYDPGACSHAGECVRGLPEVFDAKARPWVRPGAAPIERIAEVVGRCPSGALQLIRAGAGERAASPAPPSAGARIRISVAPDGPLVLAGSLEIRGPDGALLFEGNRTALCRCGHSRRKPFCDGTHRGSGFKG